MAVPIVVSAHARKKLKPGTDESTKTAKRQGGRSEETP